jgi:rhodanese-related sulfurtransferase
VDTREAEEYAVSHLPGAVHLGYSDPDFSVLEGVDAARPLVLYCTVGYRSERMASELRQRGFSRVYNLYGSLYAWKLAGLPLRDGNGFTERMHTYNRKWGTYIPDSLGTKVH